MIRALAVALAVACLLPSMQATAQTRGDPYEAELDRARDARAAADLERSETLSRQVLLKDPTSTRAFHSLGLVQNDRGRPQVALATLLQGAALLERQGQKGAAVLRYPDYSLYNTLGWALLQQGRTAEAERYLRLAYTNLDKLPRQESRLKVLNNLGYLYASTGRHAQAVPLLQQAVAGGSERARTNLARSQAALRASRARSSAAAKVP